MESNYCQLFAPHEHGIQLRDGDLEPGRPTVVALVGASFHFAQDGVHLGDAQLLVGAHGGKICRNLAKLFEQLADLRMQFVQVGV